MMMTKAHIQFLTETKILVKIKLYTENMKYRTNSKY